MYRNSKANSIMVELQVNKRYTHQTKLHVPELIEMTSTVHTPACIILVYQKIINYNKIKCFSWNTEELKSRMSDLLVDPIFMKST